MSSKGDMEAHSSAHQEPTQTLSTVRVADGRKQLSVCVSRYHPQCHIPTLTLTPRCALTVQYQQSFLFYSFGPVGKKKILTCSRRQMEAGEPTTCPPTVCRSGSSN